MTFFTVVTRGSDTPSGANRADHPRHLRGHRGGRGVGGYLTRIQQKLGDRDESAWHRCGGQQYGQFADPEAVQRLGALTASLTFLMWQLPAAFWWT